MKLFQIINLIFGIIGAIGVIIQIKNSFEQKQKMGVSYAVYPVITGQTYSPPVEIDQNTILKEIFIKETYLDWDEQEKSKNEKITQLFVEQIEFKNIGKKNINGSDFFENDRLGVKNSSNILQVSISNQTPSYINAKIEFTKEKINVNFDIIKPGDSIYLCIVCLDNFRFYTSDFFSGQTKEINKLYPLDVNTYHKYICNNISYCYLESLYLKNVWNNLRKMSFFYFFPFILLIIIMLIVNFYISGGLNVK